MKRPSAAGKTNTNVGSVTERARGELNMLCVGVCVCVGGRRCGCGGCVCVCGGVCVSWTAEEHPRNGCTTGNGLLFHSLPACLV